MNTTCQTNIQIHIETSRTVISSEPIKRCQTMREGMAWALGMGTERLLTQISLTTSSCNLILVLSFMTYISFGTLFMKTCVGCMIMIIVQTSRSSELIFQWALMPSKNVILPIQSVLLNYLFLSKGRLITSFMFSFELNYKWSNSSTLNGHISE